jgi:radical SAM superfamily enzyme YgiQ (UPF0313 family)
LTLASAQHRPPAKRRVLLVNPQNELVAITNTKNNFFNRFRIWKPLGLMVLAGRTPPDWEVQLVDENLGAPDYDAMPNPDLVGISAFTSQANAAYALAERFRRRGVPVVMGGVHATMRTAEASERVDAVVTGEGDDVWEELLADAARGTLKKLYAGRFADMDKVPPARHDLLPDGYFFGSLQISRGCPVNCAFCSVTAFNGTRLRSRPIESVIAELGRIKEKWVLVADDNLIGTNKRQIAYAKDLFRAMAKAKHGKKWMGQVTINFGDDEELLELARQAGCFGVLVGFESPTAEGLGELDKTFNTKGGRNLRESVARIQKHGIMVAGSFALGLDVDQKGIGRKIADAGHEYGIDVINTLFLTPLPGTRLFDRMLAEGRIIANDYPADWKYYTFTYPVARYRHLDWPDAVREMSDVNRYFYSFPRIAHRVTRALWRTRSPFNVFAGLATNLSYRFNRSKENQACSEIDLERERSAAPRARTA